jgi:hypothetical protein
MFLSGAALGLMASQLGNVTMSAVGETKLSEAGGIQGVFQNLGSSLGTALIGSVLIASLSSGFAAAVASSSLSESVKSSVATATAGGITPVAVAEVPAIAQEAGLNEQDAKTLGSLYTQAQLDSIQLSLAALAIISCASLFFSRNLPREVLGRKPAPASSEEDPSSRRRQKVPRTTGR